MEHSRAPHTHLKTSWNTSHWSSNISSKNHVILSHSLTLASSIQVSDSWNNFSRSIRGVPRWGENKVLLGAPFYTTIQSIITPRKSPQNPWFYALPSVTTPPAHCIDILASMVWSTKANKITNPNQKSTVKKRHAKIFMVTLTHFLIQGFFHHQNFLNHFQWMVFSLFLLFCIYILLKMSVADNFYLI